MVNYHEVICYADVSNADYTANVNTRASHIIQLKFKGVSNCSYWQVYACTNQGCECHIKPSGS